MVATPQEKRRLLKCGRKLGVQLWGLISIVSYQTFVRWIREKEASHTEEERCIAQETRSLRTPHEIRKLVLQSACENNRAYSWPFGQRCEAQRTSPNLPNSPARVERFIQTSECKYTEPRDEPREIAYSYYSHNDSKRIR